MTNASKIAKQLGKLGGETTKRRHGKEHFKRISKLGVEARKSKQNAKNKEYPSRGTVILKGDKTWVADGRGGVIVQNS